MIVVHSNRVVGDELAVFRDGVHASGVHRVRGRILLRGGFRLNHSGGADGHLDGAILPEAPVHQVVVVSDRGGRTQDQLAAGPAIDGAVLEVTPRGVAAGALKQAGELRSQFRCAALPGGKSVKVGRVGWTIEAGA